MDGYRKHTNTHVYPVALTYRSISKHKRNKMKDLTFSFIDGSGELSNLKMSSYKNEFPVNNLNSLIFEFACLDIKLVKLDFSLFYRFYSVLEPR